MTDPTPPKRRPGRPKGEPKEPEFLMLPTRVKQMITEIQRALPTHPDGKRWTRTDVVCRAVEDLHQTVMSQEGPTADRSP